MPQTEFTFRADSDRSGLDSWHEEQRQARKELARQLGLPLGRTVEVWLRDGVRLRGVLRLHEEQLIVEEARRYQLELQVDRVVFKHGDVESCLVLADT